MLIEVRVKVRTLPLDVASRIFHLPTLRNGPQTDLEEQPVNKGPTRNGWLHIFNTVEENG